MKHIFIINPRAGREKENISVRVRSFIATRPDLQALVFTTEYSGHETILVGRLCHIFEDETIRLYICGGSGTLCRAVSGIPNLAMVEIAFFPCGMTNDILKVFEGEAEPFRNLNALTNGTPMYLDLLDFGFGKALNFCSTGFDAKVAMDVNSLARFSIVGSKLPYYTAIVKNAIAVRHSMYTINLDGNDFSGRKTMITCMNGITYGGSFTPFQRVSPVNAKMKTILYDAASLFAVAKHMNHFRTGRLDKIGSSLVTLEGSELRVKAPEGRSMFFSADGESFDMREQKNEYVVRVMPAALKFVLPQNVVLKEQCREQEGGV